MSIYENMEDFEYCGECCVCDKPVDPSEMGNCGYCGQVFHWSECGDWHGHQHGCDRCKSEHKEY